MDNTIGNIKKYIKPLSKQEFNNKINSLPIDDVILKMINLNMDDIKIEKIKQLNNILKTKNYNDLGLKTTLNSLFLTIINSNIDNILEKGDYTLNKMVINTNLFNQLSSKDKLYAMYNDAFHLVSAVFNEDYNNILIEKYKEIKNNLPDSRYKIGILILLKYDINEITRMVKDNKPYRQQVSDFEFNIMDEAILAENYDAFTIIVENTTIDPIDGVHFKLKDLIKMKDKRFVNKFLENINKYNYDTTKLKQILTEIKPYIKF